MSYSEILTLLNETHQNMEQRRTQFHDSKKVITRAETLLTGFKEEKIDYRTLDLQEAQSAFDSGDYESASNQANRVAEVAEIDLFFVGLERLPELCLRPRKREPRRHDDHAICRGA